MSEVEVRRTGLTLRAPATATIASIRRAAADAGLEVVGLPGGRDESPVGATVLAGELPRRSLCGIELEGGGDDVVRCGGSVLKDVAGYDLVALLLGSGGRLGEIRAVHLRLAPPDAGGPSWAALGTRPADGLEAAIDPLARARR